MRFGAYVTLLTDQYPSTEDEQAVQLDLDYPDVKQDLNRFLPLVKWLLVIPHVIVLIVLAVGAIFAIFIAWFAILFTGRYPRRLFGELIQLHPPHHHLPDTHSPRQEGHQYVQASLQWWPADPQRTPHALSLGYIRCPECGRLSVPPQSGP